MTELETKGLATTTATSPDSANTTNNIIADSNSLIRTDSERISQAKEVYEDLVTQVSLLEVVRAGVEHLTANNAMTSDLQRDIDLALWKVNIDLAEIKYRLSAALYPTTEERAIMNSTRASSQSPIADKEMRACK